MSRLIIFGGTTEGRLLAGHADSLGVPALVCVATEYGESLLGGNHIEIKTGRMDSAAITELLCSETPSLVVDATHPYATEVSANIKTACTTCGARLIRVVREDCGDDGGCIEFTDMPSLIAWLAATEGNILVTTGAKEAEHFTALPGFAERVYFRMLAIAEGVEKCVKLGYKPSHLICMQGPFSKELNIAILRHTGVKILVTKQSGASGGFVEKLEAARECGVTVAVLSRQSGDCGVALSEAMSLISEVFS